MDRAGDRLHAAREDFLGDLRREERRDLLLRKQVYFADGDRNSSMVEESDNSILPLLTVYGEMAPALAQVVKQTHSCAPELDQLENYAQMIISGNLNEQHRAIILIRKVASSEVDEGCDLLLRTDVLPYLVELAKRDEHPYLQMEANWTLSNFCSRSPHIVLKVIEKGVIPIFLQNIVKPSLALAEQVVWGIGNLAAESQEYSEMLHSHNALHSLVSLYEKVKDGNKLNSID